MSVVKLLSRIVAPEDVLKDQDDTVVDKRLHDHTYGKSSNGSCLSPSPLISRLTLCPTQFLRYHIGPVDPVRGSLQRPHS